MYLRESKVGVNKIYTGKIVTNALFYRSKRHYIRGLHKTNQLRLQLIMFASHIVQQRSSMPDDNGR